MSEQSDRTGRSDSNRRLPRSQGCRRRAEGLHGQLALDPSWTLSASEIGAFAFCPQAWYLQRCRVPVTAATDARRRAGSRLHRDIGHQTDLVRAAGALQSVLLIGIGLVILLLAALMLRGFG